MKKKGVFGLSWNFIGGIIIGIAVLIIVLKIGGGFAKLLFPSDEKLKLEESIEGLSYSIDNLQENEKEEVLFHTSANELYLMSFNKDNDVKECFNIPCVAICFDNSCNSILYYREVFIGLVFENPGEVAVLNKADGKIFSLTVENNENKISITPSYQN